MRTLFIFLFSALVLHGHVCASDEVWLIADGGNGHSYRVVASGDIEWDEARLEAEKLGGYLATITSKAENDFVFGLIDEPQFWTLFSGRNFGPWIGAFQPEGSKEPAGGWTWLNDDGLLSNTFQNWAPGEPNDNGSANENIVLFFSLNSNREDTWNDTTPFSSVSVVAYVVEFDTPIILGDANLDGTVDLLDVSPFVELLSTGGHLAEADFDCDGIVSLLDVAGFVIAILNGG